MRSSVPPLARMTFEPGFAPSARETGETARHRMAEEWALKRKVSAKRQPGFPSFEFDRGDGKVAVTPCRIRSYEPTTTWIVRRGPLYS